MPKPRVAVLLAAHWPGPELEQQLQTILGQLGVDVRLYVGHDTGQASKTSTAGAEGSAHEIALRQRLALPSVRLVYDEAIGCAAQNFFRLIRSVDFSRYDWVALSDQDDLWHPDKLQRAIQVLTAQPEAQGYSANVSTFRGHPDHSAHHPHPALGADSGSAELANTIVKSQPQRCYDHFFEAAGPGCTYVISRRLALALQAWLVEQPDDRLSMVRRHDWLIYAWARTHGYGWQIDPRVVLDYRQHGRNVVGAHLGWSASMARLQQVRQGWFRSQALAVAQLVDPQGPVVRGLKSGSRWHRLVLAWQGRRRLRDRLALCAFVLVGWV